MNDEPAVLTAASARRRKSGNGLGKKLRSYDEDPDSKEATEMTWLLMEAFSSPELKGQWDEVCKLVKEHDSQDESQEKHSFSSCGTRQPVP